MNCNTTHYRANSSSVPGDPTTGGANLRPDGRDIIFGGAGTQADRNDQDLTLATPDASRHARDADTIVGDNGRIIRIVGVNGTDINPVGDPTKPLYVTFNYDNYGPEKIVVRGVSLLDYTAGGPDFDPAAFGLSAPSAGPCSSAGSETMTSCSNVLQMQNELGRNTWVRDIGGNDEIHGETGDDTAYGGVGRDVFFGDADDDDLIGGWGADWFSGGTGSDAILGDDGRIFTSRNTGCTQVNNQPDCWTTQYSEPLYGIYKFLVGDPDPKITHGYVLDEFIYTPGQIQTATINVNGALSKVFDFTPFNHTPAANADQALYDANNSDDILFGGLGNDFLHGGSGDDAISGAEALMGAYTQRHDRLTGALIGVVQSGWDTPYNPGNALNFGADHDAWHSNGHTEARLGEFALYDEYDPRRAIALLDSGLAAKTTSGWNWFLNWSTTEGPLVNGCVLFAPNGACLAFNTAATDGDDVIFGDLGNDWLVGGTGKDTLWGGWGNDLLNADDVVAWVDDPNYPDPKHPRKIQPSPNDTPDTHPTYEDRAVGGAGLDILIGNTGGDRLIDWTGEFNSYLVPFAPFGIATVSRQVPPRLFEYLYALSASQGADPTRDTDTGNLPERNGEPDGEIGLITQRDHGLWQDQAGGPTDPQAGNIPGGQRDVLRSADFNDGSFGSFAPDSGTWVVSGGALQVSANTTTADAVAVFNHDQYLPVYFEIKASVKAVKPTGGFNGNAYVIFDYFAYNDFKFAGINISTNKFEMGYRDATGWHVVAQTPVQVKPDTFYQMLVAINGSTVTVTIDGVAYFTYTFQPRNLYGLMVGLNKGMVGIGSNSARGTFDNIAIQVLPPKTTLDYEETFSGATAGAFSSPDWAVSAGRYGSSVAGSADLASLGVVTNLEVNAFIELTTVLRTNGVGGVVFDRYAGDDYKFVVLDVPGQKVLIGHVSPTGGWVVDASFAKALVANTDYTLQVTVKGLSVSVVLNGSTVGSHSFNGPPVDGRFGLLNKSGTTSFDRWRIRTNAAQFASYQPPPPPGPPPPPVPTVTVVTTDDVATELAQSSGTYELRRDGDLSTLLVVNLTWSGSGTFGVDYTVSATGGTISANGLTATFSVGSATMTILVTAKTDTIIEPTETAVVTIAASTLPGPSYVAGTQSSATISIVDNPPAPIAPQVSVADVTVTESDRRTSDVTVTVTLSAPGTSPINVTLTTANGTALAGSDYSATTKTVTFAPGVTSVTFVIAIIGDRVAESTETFVVNITSVTGGATVADGQAVVTILDNDRALTGSAEGEGSSGAEAIGEGDVDAALAAATQAWIAAGADPTALGNVTVTVVALPGSKLAEVDGAALLVDDNGAGWGWHLDPATLVPTGRMDLYSVLLHELGHLLGLEHDERPSVMHGELEPGVRLLLGPEGFFCCNNLIRRTAQGDDRQSSRLATGLVSVRHHEVSGAQSGWMPRLDWMARAKVPVLKSAPRAVIARPSSPRITPQSRWFRATGGRGWRFGSGWWWLPRNRPAVWPTLRPAPVPGRLGLLSFV